MNGSWSDLHCGAKIESLWIHLLKVDYVFDSVTFSAVGCISSLSNYYSPV